MLLALLLGCRPHVTAPPPPPAPPDFTILKGDLLELDQSIALSRLTGIAHPDRFIAVLDRLERDLRLQRDKPTGTTLMGVQDVIRLARIMRQAGAQYARWASIYAPHAPPADWDSPTPKEHWATLQQCYRIFYLVHALGLPDPLVGCFGGDA